MPGWGTGSFENEDAQSFLGRLNSLGLDDLRQMLTHAADQDYLEAPESGAVVAAAEVVAALVAAASDETSSPATPTSSGSPRAPRPLSLTGSSPRAGPGGGPRRGRT